MAQVIAVHAGGRGNLGSFRGLFKIGSELSVYVIEAFISEEPEWKKYESLLHGFAKDNGSSLQIVNACLSDEERDASFKVMYDLKASSLRNMAPEAKYLCRWDGTGPPNLLRWSRTCVPTREIPVHTTTLDNLCANGTIPFPDTLVMDIQGSDYDALLGAKSLFSHLLMVNVEAPFRRIYDGQGTFSDIDCLMCENDFVFYGFTYLKEWWEDVIIGSGFILNSEVLYFKDFRVLEPERLLTLALLAYANGRKSYGQLVANHLINSYPGIWENSKGSHVFANVQTHYNQFVPVVENFHRIAR